MTGSWSRRFPLRRGGLTYALLGLVLLASSCQDGPKRYHLSGKVTYKGKPVPTGTLYFTPDTTKGNDGPQGYAEIHSGEFDTAREGRGHAGGPHVVRIQGFDGIPRGERSWGLQLFNDYIVAVDLPQETTTRDFDVPAGKGK